MTIYSSVRLGDVDDVHPVVGPILGQRLAQSGFTMLEALIVIAIAGILTAIAAPSFRDTLNNMRMSSAQGLLQGDLNQARAEAIKRNERVIVCIRNAGGTGCDGGANWRAGWVVCPEAAVANQCIDDVREFMAVRPPLDQSLTLNALNEGGVAMAAVRFNANSSQGTGGGRAVFSIGGTWTGATSRTVTVQGSGHVSRE